MHYFLLFWGMTGKVLIVNNQGKPPQAIALNQLNKPGIQPSTVTIQPQQVNSETNQFYCYQMQYQVNKWIVNLTIHHSCKSNIQFHNNINQLQLIITQLGWCLSQITLHNKYELLLTTQARCLNLLQYH